MKLREFGHDVTILEARTWPGGRVHTLREPFADGLYAEAGAGRIPSTHALTLACVQRYKLELDPFYPESGPEVFLWRGKRLVVPRGGAHDAVSHAVPRLWKIRGGNDLLPRAMAAER